MACKIDQNKCIGCQTCMSVCNFCAISVNAEGKCVIDPTKCQSCKMCSQYCPAMAISED